MSYSIWVADDPELEQVLADLEVVEPSDYPHFSTSGAGMRKPGAEMEAQGMFAFIPLWKFQFNDGEHVTADEIAPALAIAQPEPQTKPLGGSGRERSDPDRLDRRRRLPHGLPSAP
jgi:hypothetical protein